MRTDTYGHADLYTNLPEARTKDAAKKRPSAWGLRALVDRTHAAAGVTTEKSARVTHLHASGFIIGNRFWGANLVSQIGSRIGTWVHIASGFGSTSCRDWVVHQLKTRGRTVSVRGLQHCAASWLVASA